MTRDEKIAALIESVEDWDIETLIDRVKEIRLDSLNEKTDAEIDSIYKLELE